MILRWCAESLKNSQLCQAPSIIWSLKCLLWPYKDSSGKFHSNRITLDSLSHIHPDIVEGKSFCSIIMTCRDRTIEFQSACKSLQGRQLQVWPYKLHLQLQCGYWMEYAMWFPLMLKTMCNLLQIILEEKLHCTLFENVLRDKKEHSVIIYWLLFLK